MPDALLSCGACAHDFCLLHHTLSIGCLDRFGPITRIRISRPSPPLADLIYHEFDETSGVSGRFDIASKSSATSRFCRSAAKSASTISMAAACRHFSAVRDCGFRMLAITSCPSHGFSSASITAALATSMTSPFKSGGGGDFGRGAGQRQGAVELPAHVRRLRGFQCRTPPPWASCSR